MPSLTITNQKGGVGKTTTTLNLAAALKELGLRVLVVDFDPQGSLTTACGLSDPSDLGPGRTIADALLTAMRHPVTHPASILDIIVQSPAGLDLVPANYQLALAERILYAVYGREFALRDTLGPVRHKYDLVLVDSVPTLGLLAINSLAAVDGLVIPVQAEFLAVHGLAQVLDSVHQVREHLNANLQVWGVALTMVDGRTKHSRDIVQLVRESLPGQVPVFKTEIPIDVKLKDSSRAGASVLRHDPRSRSAQAYRALAKEVAALIPAAKVASFPIYPNGLPSDDTGRGNGAASRAVQPTATTPAGEVKSVVASEAGAASSNGSIGAPPNGMHPVGANGNGHDPVPLAAIPRLPGVCPYLGLAGNPAVHRPQPDANHRCYVASPALQIPVNNQHTACLTMQHTTCERFFRASLNSVTPPTNSSAAEEKTSVVTRLRKLVLRDS